MLPTEFRNLARFMEIPHELWREVLDAAGDRARLADSVFTPHQLLDALSSGPVGDKLLGALEVIFELGTDAGRELLLNTADEHLVSIGEVEHIPASELAARLWIRSLGDVPLHEVLSRALVNALGAEHLRTQREFVGKTAKSTRRLEVRSLRTLIGQKCTELHQSEALEVRAHQSERDWRCEILRGDAAKRVLEVRSGQPGVLNYQPASSDHLRYDPETGRLAISTRSPRRLRMYREVMGSLLADDPEFFAGENICSLKPLQEHGSKLFDDHSLVEIRHVYVTELCWRRGERDKLWVSGRDCFRLLRDVGARLSEGEFIEAKLAIDFAGQTRRGTVVIKVPNRIEIKAGANESLVERLLDRVGIRGNFEDGERKDFWALYPWRLNIAGWRQYVGGDFERLLKQRVLRRADFEAVTHPRHPAATGALAVEAVDATTIIGVSDDPAISLRTLTTSDIEAYEPDCRVLARELARAAELTGAVSELTSGLWTLGRRELAPAHTLAVFAALRRPGDVAAPFIREASKGARPVLLVPRGCACELPFPQVECDLPKGPYDDVLSKVIEQLELQAHVPPALWVRQALIIDEQRGTAWYKGVELTHLRSGTHPWIFAVAVARAGGDTVLKDTLQTLLSPHSHDETVVRKAKRDFVDALKKSFDGAGKEVPGEQAFTAAGGGYRLATTVRFLDLKLDPSGGLAVACGGPAEASSRPRRGD